MKLFESDKTYAFLDINPLSRGHAVRIHSTRASHLINSANVIVQLVIPKHHGEKLTDIPDDCLAELLPVAKKIASAVGAKDFNILQNNGRIAHQEVDHVHGKS